MNTLICMVGIPRSGKSTYAKELGFPIVCPDEIRLALHGKAFEPLAEDMVWAIAKIMVRALFGAGHEYVVLDATNVTKRARNNWKSKKWDTEFIVIPTPVSLCIKRAKACDFPVEVVERMSKNFEPLEADELPYDLVGEKKNKAENDLDESNGI